MPIDIEQLKRDPDFLSLPKSDQQQALAAAMRENGGTPVPTASPTPSPAPTSRGFLTHIIGPSPAATPSPPATPSLTGPLDPMNRLGQKPLNLEEALSNLKQGERKIPYAGRVLSAVTPGTSGELYGDVAMAATGGTSLIPELIIPPVSAAVGSYLTGSRVGPGMSALKTVPGVVAGAATRGAQQWLLRGPGASGLEAQFADDLSNIGNVLNHDLPDVVPAGLKTPAQFLNYFTKRPEDLWGQYLRTGEGLIKQADALEARAANMPIGPKGHWLKQADKLRAQGEAAIEKYHEHADPFSALQTYFGFGKNFKSDQFNKFINNPVEFQDFLADANKIRILRDGGIKEDTITGLRQAIYRRPGEAPDVIMSAGDKPAVPLHPGIRLHQQGGSASERFGSIPRTIFHFDFPHLAKLTGKADFVDPSDAWAQLISVLGSRLTYGVSDFTEYPTPAATGKK